MAVDASVQVTELTVNDHACLTYGEQAELLDLTAAFVRDGLSSGLKVVWLSDEAPEQAVAELSRRGVAVEAALAAGQMSALTCEGPLLSGHMFTAGQAIGWLTGQVTASQREGFAGLRVALDMSWALRPVAGVEQLPDFEHGMAAALAGSRGSVLCQYDRERFDPVTLASVATFHTRAVAAATYHADPVLRICRQYAPPGLRLAGEIDYQAHEPLALALAEAIRLDRDIVINMTGLSFIDASCIRMIVDAARSVEAARAPAARSPDAAWTAPARRVVLEGQPALVRRFAMFGADEIPGVTLVGS